MSSHVEGQEKVVGVVKGHVVHKCCWGEALGSLEGAARELALVEVEDWVLTDDVLTVAAVVCDTMLTSSCGEEADGVG